jgi:hypothetical protein
MKETSKCNYDQKQEKDNQKVGMFRVEKKYIGYS